MIVLLVTMEQEEIIREEKERGVLIILSCHEEEKLKEYTDVLVIMENGKIIECQGENL